MESTELKKASVNSEVDEPDGKYVIFSVMKGE
jgi:hypothetical protein